MITNKSAEMYKEFKNLVMPRQNGVFSIYGEIKDETEQRFNEFLKQHPKDFKIYINSAGGNFHNAMSIHNQIKNRNVDVYIPSMAHSAAALIAAGGKTINMGNRARLMFHGAYYGTNKLMNKKDLENSIEWLDNMNSDIKNVVKEASGLDDEKITELMTNETHMDFEQAKANGFKVTPYEASYVNKCEDVRREAYRTLAFST